MDTSFIHEIENCSCFVCPRLNDPQKKFFFNLVLTFLTASGFLLILLGCSLWPNGWWSSFVLIPLVIAGLPDFFFNRIRRRKSGGDVYVSSFTEPSYTQTNGCRLLSKCEDWWFVIGGFFAATAFPALIVTLNHNGIVHKYTLALNISGTFLIGISMFIFIKLIYNKWQFSLLQSPQELDDILDGSDDEDLLNLNNGDE